VIWTATNHGDTELENLKKTWLRGKKVCGRLRWLDQGLPAVREKQPIWSEGLAVCSIELKVFIQNP
jgi:hypothetical protein